jgi:coenzyme F420-0:L-glutamate ligase / coenzyme F420-1:gamma-L-glutamate ligase
LSRVEIDPLPGLPEVRPGGDLAALVAGAGLPLEGDDVLVLSHKVVSKAEGRLRALAGVEPGERAREIAAAQGKDPRHVQVVLDESAEVVRADHGVLICVTHHGFVCANAGVDASNAPAEGTVVLLPRDPDGAARAIRGRLRARTGAAPAVVIADSFGRAWRLGQADVAIGCAGLGPLDDRRGEADTAGREMRATLIALADQAAAAADLARHKTSREPAVRVRGLGRHVTEDDGPGAAALLRPPAEDLFR